MLRSVHVIDPGGIESTDKEEARPTLQDRKESQLYGRDLRQRAKKEMGENVSGEESIPLTSTCSPTYLNAVLPA